MTDDNKKGGLKQRFLDEMDANKASPVLGQRASVATSDARMARSALEMRGRRASLVQSDLRAKRATVATSDARMAEGRRDEKMEAEFLARIEQNRGVEKAVAKSMAPVLRGVGRRMSVMAGYDVGEADEEQDELDGQSNTEGVLNMLNNALGTGMLALACVMLKAGLFFGLSTMLFSCCINCYTMLTHVKACKYAKCDPAGATLGEIAMGRPGFYTMTVIYVVICFFAMVSYVDASADCMKTVLAIFFPSINDVNEVVFKVVNWAVFLVPGTFIRELGGVAVMSLISFIGALSVLATILIRCGGGLAKAGMPDTDLINWWPQSVAALLAAAPVLIFCFAIQAGGGIIIGGLKDDSDSNQRKVCCGSFGVVFCLEVVVSMLGYLFFLDKTPSNVITAFPANDPVANMGRCGVLCMVICGYVMLNVPTRVMLIQLIFDKNESVQEASFFQFAATNIGVSVCALLVGLAISDLSLVLGFCGAVATPMICFIMPALFMVMVRAKSDDQEVETPVWSMKNIDMYAVFVTGVVAWFVFCFALFLSLAGYQITDSFGIAKAPPTPA